MDRKRCPWSACLGAAVLLGVLGFAPSSLSAQRDEMRDEIWTLDLRHTLDCPGPGVWRRDGVAARE